NGGNVNATPKPTEFKSYKGFRLYRDRLYIRESDMGQDKHYELKSANLVELYKYASKSIYVLEELYGNGTIESAIEFVVECKYLPIPKQPNSLVFDCWFNDLGISASSFINTCNVNRIDSVFIDFDAHYTYWDEFRKKDERMISFISDDKIKC